MVDNAISTIYKQTYSIIQSAFSIDCERILELYKRYLYNKYERLISNIVNSEADEIAKKYVASFVDDEKRIFNGLNDQQILAIIEKDDAFEQLSFLSDIAFEQAKECYRSGKYYRLEDEYLLRLEELSKCLDNIKPYNIEAAQDLLSEALLDIEYIFGKSEITSFRLSHII